MKKKIVWLVVSGLLVVSLVLSSCAPAVPEEKEVAPPTEEKAPPVKETAPPVVEEKEVAPTPGAPQYGGSITWATSVDIRGFDETYMTTYDSSPIHITHEGLVMGDWTRGQAGTGEQFWMTTANPGPVTGPLLAESWEFPDDKTMVFHIRQGVHWQDKSPVNGRELVAEDVAYTQRWIYKYPRSYNRINAAMGYLPESIEATDKYTVVIKVPGGIGMFFEDMTDKSVIIAPEMIETYGDLRDWKKSECGTGPFILTDYVPGSSLSFVKNPTYWRKDPIGPGKGNQLPYVDSLKWLIIKDPSTRTAALRTGKLDVAAGSTVEVPQWDEAEIMLEQIPEMQSIHASSTTTFYVALRNDKKPFNDRRVRQAMALSINQQEMIDTLYGGYADLLSFISDGPQFAGIGYESLDQLPENIQELFGYYPDKARALLAEAGYPDGFSFKVVAYEAYVDDLSVLKSYWEKVGINMEIDLYEYSVYRSIYTARKHEDALYRTFHAGQPERMNVWRTGTTQNTSIINDPYIDEMFETWSQGLMWFDYEERAKLIQQVALHYYDQTFEIPIPSQHQWSFWWPWLNNYHGEYSVGHYNMFYHFAFAWVDQDLKESMGY